MSDNFDSFELTDFKLEGQIQLGNKHGLLRLDRSEDGRLILVADSDHDLIDTTAPSSAKIADVDSVLGFSLDIGIRKERKLTSGHGYYFGHSLIAAPQSQRLVNQGSYDETFFDQAVARINAYFQSGNSERIAKAIKTSGLFRLYNNARLLFPNYYNESYLNLVRVLDALADARGRYDFATWAAQISPALNSEIYSKVSGISTFSTRVQISANIFSDALSFTQSKKWSCSTNMANLDQAGQFVFSCLYSAYQYRSKFVHQGFPFPDTVKDRWDNGTDSGLAYLSAAEGISHILSHQPTGLQSGDHIDIHNIIDPAEAADFKDKYFKLIPSWHFMKRLVRESLTREISTLV